MQAHRPLGVKCGNFYVLAHRPLGGQVQAHRPLGGKVQAHRSLGGQVWAPLKFSCVHFSLCLHRESISSDC